MSFYIIKADITSRDVDAIVCTANTNLHLGGNIGKKIINKAGPDILKELNTISHCDVGSSVITKGYGLKARHVIHTVGPKYIDGKHNEAKLLKKAYLSALNLAVENNLESLEIPLISAGTYKYPPKEAVEIAIKTITAFLKDNELNVGLVIYSDNTFKKCKDLFEPFIAYTGEGFVDHFEELIGSAYRSVIPEFEMSSTTTSKFAEPIESFNAKLIKFLNKSGKTNAQVYKKAGIDRKHFSKLLSNKDASPKRLTIFALIIGLELDINDANELLNSVGCAFSDSYQMDIIIKNFVIDRNYDNFEIRDALAEYNLPLIC